MKSRRCLLPFVILLLVSTVLSSISCSGNVIVIAGKGKSQYRIVLSSKASPSENHAALELQHFIMLATGTELPIIGDEIGMHDSNGRIFIGDGPTVRSVIGGSLDTEIETLGDEGFILRTMAGEWRTPDIVIFGGRRRGTMYGVYTFLERLGIRWYTNRITRYPAGRRLATQPLNLKVIPPFMSRDTSIKEARDADWAARNRLNGMHSSLDETRGGRVGVLGVHTLSRLVPPSLFKEHPEWFPMIGGKRVTGLVQRCVSNPDLVDVAVKNLREWMDSEPDQRIFSVSANDVGKLCECPECKEIVDEEGANAGLYLRFVNAVAESIETSHPQNFVSTLAYAITEKAPKITRPRQNVIIRLCPFYICVGHTFTECSKGASVRFYQTLKDWSAVSDNIFIWHYATNFDAYLLPFPNFREFTHDIGVYSDNAVSGLFLQGAGKAGSCNSDLRAWVAAQLMWDQDLDPDELVNEWMQAVYGNAYEPMRAIFDHIHTHVDDPDNHLGIHDRVTHESWPPEELTHLDSLYTAAEVLASGDEDALYYVRKNRMSIRYLDLLFNSGKLVLKDGRYVPTGNTVTREEYDLYRRDMEKYGVEGLREEPFDCVYEDLLGEKLIEHETVSVENEDIRITVVPDLGGRIVSIMLKKTGDEVLGSPDPLNYFYPAYGGYEESTTMTWGRTGFANSYTAEVTGRTLKLIGEEGLSHRSKGLVFERTLTLPKRGAQIDFDSSIINISDETKYARLISHMELNTDPAEAVVVYADRNGKLVEEAAKSFYRNGVNTPKGRWSVKNTAAGWIFENRFNSAEVEGCRLLCYGHTKTMEMEVYGFEHDIVSGGKLTRKHSWEIKK
ncbi:DUF4838 domain-containing protein [Candidatus Latescibacterota bacterium]